MILCRSFHTIDVPNKKTERIYIPEGFNEFINNLIEYISKDNRNKKDFICKDSNRTVPHCISAIVAGIEDDKSTESLMDSIAGKLLDSEINAQAALENLKKTIKQGSLFQALVRDDNDELLYIIAKVEHKGWYNSENLMRFSGFPEDEIAVWKSAIFPVLHADEEPLFGTISVYVDSEAKYWTKMFLEINEATSDDNNTIKAYNATVDALNRELKPISDKDRRILVNSFLREFKTKQMVNYADMVNRIFDNYTPDATNWNVEYVKDRILKLPEKKQFDTQFMAVPEAIKDKAREIYDVAAGIELRIKGVVNDYRNAIRAEEDSMNGRRLIIECTNPETYEKFAR